MLEELNPFGWPVILAVVASFPLFYLVGSVFLDRLENSILSVAVRTTIGLLAIVSTVAVVRAGMGTGMVFYLALLIWMATQTTKRFDFSDIKELSWQKLVAISSLVFIVFVLEATRSNLVDEANVYVGNSDVSFYGANGHLLFLQGVEAFPENTSPEMNGMIYHFGDLWVSGMYSNIFQILPYYAYNIVYRTMCIVLIMLMMFGWINQVSNRYSLAFIGACLSVTAVYVDLFPIPWPEISLFQLFPCNFPSYGAGAYLIVGLVGIAFAAISYYDKRLLGAMGLLLLPFINAGLAVGAFAAGGFYLVLNFFRAMRSGNWQDLEFRNSLILFVIGGIPILYFLIDGRLDTGGGETLSVAFAYLFTHTLVRLILSQLFVIPFLLGVCYYAFKDNPKKHFYRFQLAFYLGVIVSMAFVFSKMQGNSVQITSIHFTAVMAPISLIALFSLFAHPKLRFVAFICLLGITAQAIRIGVSSNGYRIVYDWGAYSHSYKEEHSTSIEEWKKARSILNKRVNKVGYFICDTTASGGIRYNEFTKLKGIFPGTVFYRLNPLPSDARQSIEELGYYKDSGLGYFAYKNKFKQEETTNEFMEFLKPEFILQPKLEQKYCLPNRFEQVFSKIEETEHMIFYVANTQ